MVVTRPFGLEWEGMMYSYNPPGVTSTTEIHTIPDEYDVTSEGYGSPKSLTYNCRVPCTFMNMHSFQKPCQITWIVLNRILRHGLKADHTTWSKVLRLSFLPYCLSFEMNRERDLIVSILWKFLFMSNVARFCSNRVRCMYRGVSPKKL